MQPSQMSSSSSSSLFSVKPFTAPSLAIFLTVLLHTWPNLLCHRAIENGDLTLAAADSIIGGFWLWMTAVNFMWYNDLPNFLPSSTGVFVFLSMMSTILSVKFALNPRSITVPSEKRLAPSSGTNNTSFSLPIILFPSTYDSISMSPTSSTSSLMEPIPCTFQDPGSTDFSEEKKYFRSVIWCVAPESAYQSFSFFDRKQYDESMLDAG